MQIRPAFKIEEAIRSSTFQSLRKTLVTILEASPLLPPDGEKEDRTVSQEPGRARSAHKAVKVSTMPSHGFCLHLQVWDGDRMQEQKPGPSPGKPQSH